MNPSGDIQPENPFVGPASLDRRHGLFGRDAERRELLYLLVSERIVLLHSPSGAGKTSLLQAGLIPDLEAQRFQPQRAIRLNLLPPGPADGNRYLRSVLESLGGALPGESLAAYLTRRFPGPRETPVLVFDQFEEVLTLDRTDLPAKQEFFHALSEALRLPRIWALFAMRDEYLSPLQPLARLLPTHLSHTYRLELLSETNAAVAMQGLATKGGRRFDAEAVAELAHQLAGPAVEPMQMQVVCRRLWERTSGAKTITLAAVLAHGDVSRALGEYYRLTMERIGGGPAVERMLREWIEAKLIAGRLRNQILEEAIDPAIQPYLEPLKTAFLLRQENRGRLWWELAHDLLVRPVSEGNADWLDTHLDPFQLRARTWARAEENPALLLNDADLLALGAGTKPGYSAQEQRYVEESRRQQQARRAARLASWLRIALPVLAVALVVAGYLGWEARQESGSQKLAARAVREFGARTECGVELARQAVALRPTWEAVETLQTLLQGARPDYAVDAASGFPAVAVSSDGSLIAVRSGQQITTFPKPRNANGEYRNRLEFGDACRLTAFDLRPDGQRIAAGFENGYWAEFPANADARIVDCGPRRTGQAILTVHYLPDGRVAVASPRNGIKVGGISLWRPEAETEITAFAVDRVSGQMAVATSKRDILLLQPDGSPIRRFYYISGPRRLTNWSAGSLAIAAGRVAAASRVNRRVAVWEVATGKLLFDRRTDEGSAAVALSPAADRLAVAGLSMTHRVPVWELPTGRELPGLGLPESYEATLTDVQFVREAEGRLAVLAADSKGFIARYPLNTDQLLRQAGDRLRGAETPPCPVDLPEPSSNSGRWRR